MTERRLTDIWQTLCADLPTWPGDTGSTCEPTWTHGPSCPDRISQAGSTQPGTQADAPLHDGPDGAAIGTMALHTRTGQARLLDLRGCAR